MKHAWAINVDMKHGILVKYYKFVTDCCLLVHVHACRDWRNMTLYSANLNFTAFKAKDRFGVSAGEKVWYL